MTTGTVSTLLPLVTLTPVVATLPVDCSTLRTVCYLRVNDGKRDKLCIQLLTSLNQVCRPHIDALILGSIIVWRGIAAAPSVRHLLLSQVSQQ